MYWIQLETGSLFVLQILSNQIFVAWIGTITTIATGLTSQVTYVAYIKGFDKLGQYIEESFADFVVVFTMQSLLIFVISCLIYFYSQDFVSSNSENLILQQKQRVLENLHEAIVCKTKEGISYCND